MRDVEKWRERNKRLHTNFNQLLGGEQGSLVAYHLGDIREGAANLVEMIDQIAATDPPLDREATLKVFHGIMSEFDDHLLPNHVTPVRAMLTPLIHELYAKFDDEEEGEQADIEDDRSN